MNSACTHYGDLQGTSAADLHPDTRLEALAYILGIDTNGYAPVGIRLWGTPPKIVALYAIDIGDIGIMDFEALCEFVRSKPDEVRLKMFQLPVEADMDTHLKEFEAAAIVKGLDLSQIELLS